MKLADKIRDFLRRHDGTVKPWTGTDAGLDADMKWDETAAKPPTLERQSDRRWLGIKVSWRW